MSVAAASAAAAGSRWAATAKTVLAAARLTSRTLRQEDRSRGGRGEGKRLARGSPLSRSPLLGIEIFYSSVNLFALEAGWAQETADISSSKVVYSNAVLPMITDDGEMRTSAHLEQALAPEKAKQWKAAAFLPLREEATGALAWQQKPRTRLEFS